MTDDVDRIDCTPLDPTADPERFETIVRSITTAASAGLAARRARSNVFGQVASWWRPLLAAAVITGVVSVAALASIEPAPRVAGSEISLAEAIGMPEQIAGWVRSDEAPEPAELLLTLED